MTAHPLRSIGWNSFFEQQVPPALDRPIVAARVSAHHGSQVLFLGESGEFAVPTQLAESVGEVAVGDWLLLDAENHRAVFRFERQTLLERKASGEEVKSQPIAANIDTMLIVSSCNEDFNLSRIERYLALAIQAGINPIVVLTKADLTEHPADLRREVERLHGGLLVETLDARDPVQTEVLKVWCKPGQSVALLGSSGVGKSTLAVALGAGELETGAIREKDGKGRHTTTTRSLHLLSSGGVLVDNPGMRELQLPACEQGVNDVFDDVLQIARQCRFKDCNHEGDLGCAVTEAIEGGQLDRRRLISYKKLLAEQARHSQSLAVRRERDRKTGKLYKSIISAKQQRRQ